MPIISVIIPFYKGIQWLEEAVDSVLQQTFTDYEILIINDGSCEIMDDFLDKYKHKITYVYKQNGGPSTARNLGIELAKGKYIAFLDSDDRWLPNKLEIQYKEMENFKAYWSYCGYRTFGLGKSKVYLMASHNKVVMERYNSPYIATPGVMIRRDILVNNPLLRFNEQLRYGQDSFFWICINAIYPVLVIPQVLFEVRLRGSNASLRARVQLEARSNIWIMRKKNKDEFIKKFQVSKIYIIASELCVHGYRIIKKYEQINKNNQGIELVSKFIYCVPWLLFKIDRIAKR